MEEAADTEAEDYDVVRREVKPLWVARSGNVGCYPTLILISPTFPLKTRLVPI
jgi:hypothetical protein